MCACIVAPCGNWMPNLAYTYSTRPEQSKPPEGVAPAHT